MIQLYKVHKNDMRFLIHETLLQDFSLKSQKN